MIRIPFMYIMTKRERGNLNWVLTPQFITHHITTLERFLRGKF